MKMAETPATDGPDFSLKPCEFHKVFSFLDNTLPLGYNVNYTKFMECFMKKEYFSPTFTEIKVTSAEFILGSFGQDDSADDFDKEDFKPGIESGDSGIF